jgi:hypothetical protein
MPKGRIAHQSVATWIAIVVGLALLGGGCGWLVRHQWVAREREALRETLYLRTLVDAHQMFALQAPTGVTLAPDDFGRLARQIDQELEATVRLPTGTGWPHAFRGGRLLPLGGEPAALLIFERSGDLVSLIVLRDKIERAAFSRPLEDTSVSVAADGNFRVGVVGRVSPDDFAVLRQIIGGSDTKN